MWKANNFDHAGYAQHQLQDRDLIPSDVEDPLPAAAPNRVTMAPPQQQQSSFPTELPPRPEASSGSRGDLCPGARFCWPFQWTSWSLNTNGDHAALLRRVCMWVTLLVRTAVSILGLIMNLYGANIGGLVIGIILSVLGFFFIAFCLARIGEAQGSRRVLGMTVNRWHFDIFLLGSAAIHVALIFIVLFIRSQIAFVITWYGMWILIFAVYWITTWTPESSSYV